MNLSLARQFRSAVSMLAFFTLLTGGLYPAVITVTGQWLFPRQAHGSLIVEQGQIVGSELIGQHFDADVYFWGRLSATGPVPYNAAASSGSNFGPLHPGLRDAAVARVAVLRSRGGSGEPVPVDLVTSSASGLDPHITPAAAEYQVRRVARARGISEESVRQAIVRHTTDRRWGILGEPTVNVLMLNLELDRMANRN
ncbi:MAG: potassium-transporting ATPase subunit KdpC [Pirellulales bacterium]